MLDTLVVVATNNGKKYLERFLSAVHHPYPVLLVDTGSTDPASIEYLAQVKKRYPSLALMVAQTPYRGYDTGAYLWAYWQKLASNYLFLQDSLFPRVEDYVAPFRRVLPGKGAVSWSSFPMTWWDSDDQKTAIKWMYKYGEMPDEGIFGPVFYTNSLSLDILTREGVMPTLPMHKEMAQAMERAWAIAFYRAKLPVYTLAPGHNPDAMADGRYPVFTKVRPQRA